MYIDYVWLEKLTAIVNLQALHLLEYTPGLFKCIPRYIFFCVFIASLDCALRHYSEQSIGMASEPLPLASLDCALRCCIKHLGTASEPYHYSPSNY